MNKGSRGAWSWQPGAHARAHACANTAGCRSEILAKSARAEFEAARHEKVCHTPTLVAESHAGTHTIANVDVVPVQDPLVIARMLVIGQDAVMQMQDKVCVSVSVCLCLCLCVCVCVSVCVSVCVCVPTLGLMTLMFLCTGHQLGQST